MRKTHVGLALAVLLEIGSGCRSQEPVIPFTDAGDPCSGGSTPHPLDCARFAETTCVVAGSVCPRETYGCADAAYFTKDDYSGCPPEAGADAPSFGDASLLGDGSISSEDAPDSPADASDASAD